MSWEPFNYHGGTSLVLLSWADYYEVVVHTVLTVAAILNEGGLLRIILTLSILVALVLGLYKVFHPSVSVDVTVSPDDSDYIFSGRLEERER